MYITTIIYVISDICMLQYLCKDIKKRKTRKPKTINKTVVIQSLNNNNQLHFVFCLEFFSVLWYLYDLYDLFDFYHLHELYVLLQPYHIENVMINKSIQYLHMWNNIAGTIAPIRSFAMILIPIDCCDFQLSFPPKIVNFNGLQRKLRSNLVAGSDWNISSKFLLFVLSQLIIKLQININICILTTCVNSDLNSICSDIAIIDTICIWTNKNELNCWVLLVWCWRCKHNKCFDSLHDFHELQWLTMSSDAKLYIAYLPPI